MAICALIFCITQVQQTYAKYLDTKEGDTDFSVAQWKILVNNQDITEAATMSSLIHPIYLENENVKDGVIAPGQKGYFDLTIDSSKTEVSFSYAIQIATSEQSSVTDFAITGYQVNDSPIVPVDQAVNIIQNNVYYNDPIKENKVRVYFQWKDGTGETMDNTADTNASISGESAKLKVNITFTQIAN